MKHISRSIYSLLLLASFSVSAQEKKADSTAVVTPPVKSDRYGIRVGVDLHRLSRSLYDDKFRGFEAVADYRLTKKIYAAGELGTVDFTIDDDQVNFTTKGSYFKIGFDYNAYENWLDMENMIYTGIRYGFSSFSQNLNSYTIYDKNPYFDEVTVYPNQKYSSLTAHWAELIGGIKAEVYDNLFLGFSVRLNILFTDKKPNNFDNLYIPGFNRTYDGSFGVGFNYTVSYFIPLYKKKIEQPEVKTKK
ncbi:hypothetical protein EPI11_09730 [Flavobacterium cerinum]|uniref:DUF3575 domain-containing protein n=2 Tax=Flavobacterium cerinum TaxID=2502784 RepID=A0A3S3QLB4_9FLAO|nr:DUF6048 family protein [Flavobacterium cerinum]RWX00604.1 hypothetical protein EPI11_09730 [Flavobacterium cerinum]